MKGLRGVRQPGFWVVVAVAVVLFGGLFLATHRRVTEEISTGYRGRARSEPFLALGRFLAEWGIPVQQGSRALEKLPPDGQILLLFASRESFSTREADAVLGWVERGGLLVVSPSAGPEDPLMARLGISKRTVRLEEAKTKDGGQQGPPEPETIRLDVWGEDIAVRTRTAWRLVAGRRDWDLAAPAPEGALVLSFPYGKGRVTVVADRWMFANARIGEAGHARLLLRVTSGPLDSETDEDRQPRTAWLYRRDSVPSFLALVNGRAGPALWTLVVLTGAALLHAGRRFGPIRNEGPPSRRSLLEHVDAAGEYFYRKGLSAVLVKATRDAVMKRLAVVEPATAAAGQRETVRRLASLSRFSPARVDQALFGELPKKPDELAGLIRTLEFLRRCL